MGAGEEETKEQLVKGQKQTEEQLASVSCSQTVEIEIESEVVAFEVVERREVAAEMGAEEEEAKDEADRRETAEMQTERSTQLKAASEEIAKRLTEDWHVYVSVQ